MPVATKPAATRCDVGADLDHYTCCADYDLALCGVDVSDHDTVDTLVHPCIVCVEIHHIDTTLPPESGCYACPMDQKKETP